MKPSITLLSVAALAFCATEAAAWAPLNNTYPRWDKMPVPYRINESTIPASIATIGKARLDQGLASWAAPSCTFWETLNMGNTTSSYNANDGQNVFMWKAGTWPSQLGPVNSVIGVTMPVWDNSSVILDADIVYNAVGFCWNDNGLNGCVDTASIATHEEGHFLGLDHSNIKGATMEPAYGGGNAIASIEQDDIDGVCSLYPSMGNAVSSGTGAGTDCNSCANQSTQNECVSQYNACGASQECVAYAQCINQCGSQACADQCAAQYPNGESIYGVLIDCACNVCAAQCVGQCGPTSGSSSSSSSGNGSSGGNGSSSGSPGTGGMGGAGGSTGSWSSDDEPPAPPPGDAGSCSCSMEPGPLRFGAFLGAGAFVLAWARRRSRKSSKR